MKIEKYVLFSKEDGNLWFILYLEIKGIHVQYYTIYPGSSSLSAHRFLRLLRPLTTAIWSSVGLSEIKDAAPSNANAANGATRVANGDKVPALPPP